MLLKKKMVLLSILLIAVLALSACAGEAGPAGAEGPAGPAGPEGPAGDPPMAADLSCTECHDETSNLYVKQQQLAVSVHGSGTATAYAGTRSSCAACHSSEGYTTIMDAGIGVEELEAAPVVPSKVNCRTCHDIHTSYTGADWALTSVEPVTLIAGGAEFDGGKGNLCVTCHQPRRVMAEATDGVFEITSTHWGPHHGPQSSMLLGQVGAGVEGKPSAHYKMVEDTCVACHLGEAMDHDFGANLAACADCHDDAETLKDEFQAEIKAMTDLAIAKLVTVGALDSAGHPVKGTFTEAEAQAAWNLIYIVIEDKSMGVHNPNFTIAMLEAALDTLADVEAAVVEESADH